MTHNHKLLHAKTHLPVGKHPDRPSHPALSAGRVGYAEEPSDSRAGGFSVFLRRILFPPAVCAVTAAFTVTAVAAALAGSADPTALIPVLAPVATAVASLAGGITAGLCHRRRAVASALCYGVILTAILCLAGVLTGQGTPVAWLTRLLPLPLHALGGFFTRPRERRIVHHK